MITYSISIARLSDLTENPGDLDGLRLCKRVKTPEANRARLIAESSADESSRPLITKGD